MKCPVSLLLPLQDPLIRHQVSMGRGVDAQALQGMGRGEVGEAAWEVEKKRRRDVGEKIGVSVPEVSLGEGVPEHSG